jgi:hypothetical protein
MHVPGIGAAITTLTSGAIMIWTASGPRVERNRLANRITRRG